MPNQTQTSHFKIVIHNRKNNPNSIINQPHKTTNKNRPPTTHQSYPTKGRYYPLPNTTLAFPDSESSCRICAGLSSACPVGRQGILLFAFEKWIYDRRTASVSANNYRRLINRTGQSDLYESCWILYTCGKFEFSGPKDRFCWCDLIFRFF